MSRASPLTNDLEDLVVAGILDIAITQHVSGMRSRHEIQKWSSTSTTKIVIAAHALTGLCAGTHQSLLVVVGTWWENLWYAVAVVGVIHLVLPKPSIWGYLVGDLGTMEPYVITCRNTQISPRYDPSSVTMPPTEVRVTLVLIVVSGTCRFGWIVLCIFSQLLQISKMPYIWGSKTEPNWTYVRLQWKWKKI